MSNLTYIDDDFDEDDIDELDLPVVQALNVKVPPRRKEQPSPQEQPQAPQMMEIPRDLYERLTALGVIPDEVRSRNIGASDYSRHIIQPWTIWQEYNLNPWDADIVKRVLRTKEGESRWMDYEKIIHICQERIRQLNNEVRQSHADGIC